MYIIENGYECDRLIRGDKLLIGNGCFGYRGTLEENTKSDCVALNAGCFYDKVGNNWREPVNMPNPLYLVIEVDGKILSKQNVIDHTEKLNIDSGVYLRETKYQINDAILSLKTQRFFSQTYYGLLCSKVEISTSGTVNAKIYSGIDADVWNINGKHFCVKSFDNDPIWVKAKTTENKNLDVKLIEKCNYQKTANTQSNDKYLNVYSVKLESQTPFILEKFAMLNYDGFCQKAPKYVDYQIFFDENNAWWKDKWSHSDIKIDDECGLDLALKYSIYQLLIYAPKIDGTSIPARGLSGQTYKGAIFWDTEMFMLPFYLNTDKETAIRLLKYRIMTLDGAKKKAKEYGYDGAFYAWESHEGGLDACSDFNVTDVFTHRPVRTYFRDKQIHISADISVAFFNAITKLKEYDLLFSGGLEMLYECSLFFASYSYYNWNKHRYELLDVIGPDEYHERVNNNAYTNYMAHETCVDFFLSLKIVKKINPKFYENFIKKNKLGIAKIRKFKNRLYLPKPNKSGLIEQFDGYFKLEDVSVDTVRSRLKNPNEYWGGSGGVATSTRVIKQADVVTLMCVLPNRFSPEVMRKNYEFYLPYTEHGSSLSACMYSMLACKVGYKDEAFEWFKTSACIDMQGGGKKYAGDVYIGGTHPASCGGAWMTAVLGFGVGKNGQYLPKQIKSLQINLENKNYTVKRN